MGISRLLPELTDIAGIGFVRACFIYPFLELVFPAEVCQNSFIEKSL